MAKKTRQKRTLTQALKQAIEASGQSHLQIAKGSGVSQAVLSRFVSGERSITLQTADKVASYLGLDLL